jgi:hypothetical protein
MGSPRASTAGKGGDTVYGTRAGQEPRPWGGGGGTAYDIWHIPYDMQTASMPRASTRGRGAHRPYGTRHAENWRQPRPRERGRISVQDADADNWQVTGLEHGRGGYAAYGIRDATYKNTPSRQRAWTRGKKST